MNPLSGFPFEGGFCTSVSVLTVQNSVLTVQNPVLTVPTTSIMTEKYTFFGTAKTGDLDGRNLDLDGRNLDFDGSPSVLTVPPPPETHHLDGSWALVALVTQRLGLQ